ncbi:SAYSvFN domain-containing protein 1-like [Dysidea avara]|uniref:SAYSvFN domain-containing protein 1-like n=1 Tax=Dysidea avara TaxID=196820 RepID=UPI00331DCDCA
MVQAQLAAYRLGLQRKMTQSNSSSSESDDDDRKLVSRRRSPSCSRRTSAVNSFPTPKEFITSEKKRKETCLSEWEMMIVIWSFWIIAFLGCYEFGFLPVFFVCFLFYAMYLTLKHSRRKPGEPSAYSVFNKNCEAIDGSITAEQFDRELRFSVK